MDGSGWVPNAARKPWLSVADAMAWIAWRGGVETADAEAATAELLAAERDLVERAGDGHVRAQGVPGLEQYPEGSIPVPIGPESFRAADVGLHLTGQMDLRSDAPLDRMVGPLSYFGSPHNNYATRGPTYHRVELSTADVLREWPSLEHLGRDVAPSAEIIPTGAPGRPTSMSLIKDEHERRLNGGEAHEALAEEARHLNAWLKAMYPTAMQPTPKTIGNAIRGAHRQHATRSPK